MLGLAIRYGHLNDVNAIAELVNHDDLERTTSTSHVEKMFERGSFLVLDREAGGPRSGLAASVFLEIREGRGAIGLLSVAPDLDAPQLPQRLLEVAEMVCVAEGCESFELRVENRDGLGDLGREMGFPLADPSASSLRVQKQL